MSSKETSEIGEMKMLKPLTDDEIRKIRIIIREREDNEERSLIERVEDNE